MPRVRKRFRKGDQVIVSIKGMREERGEVLSYPKRWSNGSIWYRVRAETFSGDVHESTLVFAD